MQFFKKHWWKILLMVVTVILSVGLWSNYRNGHLGFSLNQFRGSTVQNKNSTRELEKFGLKNGEGGFTDDTQRISANLPECSGDELLSVPPVDISEFPGLVPLGHLAPVGAHSIPMEHIEIILPQNASQNISFGTNTKKVEVKAPAKIHIFSVRHTTYMRDNKVETNAYYSMGYTACNGVYFFFEDMSGISSALQRAIQSSTNVNRSDQKEGNREFPMEIYRIDYEAQPGEVIGYAGGPDNQIGGTIEWGAYDLRKPKLNFIGLKYFKSVIDTNAVCPVDYFSEPARNQLYSKFIGNAKPTRCGTNMQDFPDTIRGDWFSQVNDPNDQAGWHNIMGIVHDNIDPTIGVIAIGGNVVSRGSAVGFSPRHSGNTNREPSEVHADGQIYCYQNDHATEADGAKINGKIILQLLDNHNLKIENQPSSCSANELFKTPFVYKR